MDQVGLAREPLLAVVHLRGEHVGALDQVQICVRVVALDVGQEILEPEHPEAWPMLSSLLDILDLFAQPLHLGLGVDDARRHRCRLRLGADGVDLAIQLLGEKIQPPSGRTRLPRGGA